MKHAILAVEGAHDQAAISKVLRMFDLESFKGTKRDLEVFWQQIIPQRKDADNLYAHEHVHIPRFFTSKTHSVAVYQGHGDRLPQNLSDIMTLCPAYAHDIHSLGIIVDADDNSPHKVAKKYADKLRLFFPEISDIPGTISASSVERSPRTGIYVFPDNIRKGTVDSVLVECADCIYPDHKAGAEVFLDGLDSKHKSHWKPFDRTREKALIATIVSVIQPGIGNTLSIARDNWICDQTFRTVSSVALLCKFLSDLLELPSR